ncbi:MAG TPA: AI-2E family transporter [Steroidobacteraceae bacterium]|nr:AI-2E family transporter [Steroidobacteraceae bacterium]
MPDDKQSQARSAGTLYPRVFAIVTVALLAYLLFLILRPFLTALAWSVLIAFLLRPADQRLTLWLRGRASLSAALLTVATFIVFIGPLTAVGVAFARQAANLVDRLQSSYGQLKFTGLSSLENIPFFGKAVRWIMDVTPFTREQLSSGALSAARALLEHLGSLGGTLFVGAMGTVIGFLLMLFLLFFFLRDGATMSARLVNLIPMPQERKRQLFTYLGAVTRAVVFGTLLTALLQGTLVGIGFAIVGLPSSVVFGAIAAVVALLPIGGTALVWVPATILLASQGRYGAALFILLWGALLVGLIDNFLKPLLISGRAEVPTLAAFLGVLGGLAAFGPIGMFLGPVVLALAIALVRWAEENRPAST